MMARTRVGKYTRGYAYARAGGMAVAAQLGREYVDRDHDEGLALDRAREDKLNRCKECGAPNDDGEGWDGLCGNCADRLEGK